MSGLIFKAAKYPFLAKESKTKRSFHHYIAYEGMIDFQSGLSSVEQHAVLPSTAKQCMSFALEKNLPYEKITLQDGTLAILLNGSSSSQKHALGLNPFTRSNKKAAALAEEMIVAKQKANKAIVYFHGGGYVAPILPQMIRLVYNFENKPRYKDGVVVYILAYGMLTHSARLYFWATNNLLQIW